jgi:enoyl-CoA hydratase
VLNALNSLVAVEVLNALKDFDANSVVSAVVITGSSRAFAAGADISEMATKSFIEMYDDDVFSIWDEIGANFFAFIQFASIRIFLRSIEPTA